MELIPTKVRIKCDNGACRNLADYLIYRPDTMTSQSLRLCKDCLKAIADLQKTLPKPKRAKE